MPEDLHTLYMHEGSNIFLARASIFSFMDLQILLLIVPDIHAVLTLKTPENTNIKKIVTIIIRIQHPNCS